MTMRRLNSEAGERVLGQAGVGRSRLGRCHLARPGGGAAPWPPLSSRVDQPARAAGVPRAAALTLSLAQSPEQPPPHSAGVVTVNLLIT